VSLEQRLEISLRFLVQYLLSLPTVHSKVFGVGLAWLWRFHTHSS
jgi:hypothetical protein